MDFHRKAVSAIAELGKLVGKQKITCWVFTQANSQHGSDLQGLI